MTELLHSRGSESEITAETESEDGEIRLGQFSPRTFGDQNFKEKMILGKENAMLRKYRHSFITFNQKKQKIGKNFFRIFGPWGSPLGGAISRLGGQISKNASVIHFLHPN